MVFKLTWLMHIDVDLFVCLRQYIVEYCMRTYNNHYKLKRNVTANWHISTWNVFNSILHANRMLYFSISVYHKLRIPIFFYCKKMYHWFFLKLIFKHTHTQALDIVSTSMNYNVRKWVLKVRLVWKLSRINQYLVSFD